MSQMHLFNPQHDYWRERLDQALVDSWQCRNWVGTSGAGSAGWAIGFYAHLLFRERQMPASRYRRLIRFQRAYYRHLDSMASIESAA